MSYRIRDIATIHNSALNNSISKQQYSIPKAQRWRNNKTEASYKYYEVPTTNSNKAPGFGTSERKGLFDVNKGLPSPDKYFVNSLSSVKMDAHPISFAKGRQECKNSNFLKGSDAPGPGSYNPNPEYVDPFRGSKYSIRVRTEQSDKPNSSAIPGPGNYTIKTSWLQKQKILSTDKRYGCPLIRPSKSKRQIINEEQCMNVPYYNPKTTMKGDEMFNKTGYSIGKSLRFDKRVKTEIPGPGTYNRFSQF